MKPDNYNEQEEEEEEEEDEEENTKESKNAKQDQQQSEKPQSHLSTPKTEQSLNSSRKLNPAAQSVGAVKGPARPPAEEMETKHGKKPKPSHHLSTAAVLSE